jgi:hypothetical protein
VSVSAERAESPISIRSASITDVPLVLRFIRELADYERLGDHSTFLGRLEWSVLDWNEPALAFYRSSGAKPVEGWTVHRISGDALERLALDEPMARPSRGAKS